MLKKIPNILTVGRILIVPFFVLAFYFPGFYGDLTALILFIVASFILSAYELYQIYYMQVPWQELLNNANKRYATAYNISNYRMLGLTGNPSINAVSIILAYTVYLMCNRMQNLYKLKYSPFKNIGRNRTTLKKVKRSGFKNLR